MLYDGRRYEGVPGERNFRIVEFAEHGMPVRVVKRQNEAPPVETKSLAMLAGSTDPEDRAELQWRISSPLSLFVLALLAVPLSSSRPREGHYAGLGAGILVYITYLNLLSVARAWVEREQVADWLGVWWVHALLGLLGIILLGRQSGWFVRAQAGRFKGGGGQDDRGGPLCRCRGAQGRGHGDHGADLRRHRI